MDLSRREFMRCLGIAVAAVAASGCQPSCYSLPFPTPTGGSGAWERLRHPWYSLDLLARDARDLERGEKTRDRLIAEHLAALDALVQAGLLNAAVADDVHLAFQSAAQHVWRANSPISCYEAPVGPYYRMESSVDLAKQADVLVEMAETSGIDPATVAQAQAAIERDMAFLSLSLDEEQALIEVLAQAASGTGAYPPLDQVSLDVPPEAAEAARVLVDVLLGKR